jgi:hypothetical protein
VRGEAELLLERTLGEVGQMAVREKRRAEEEARQRTPTSPRSPRARLKDGERQVAKTSATPARGTGDEPPVVLKLSPISRRRGNACTIGFDFLVAALDFVLEYCAYSECPFIDTHLLGRRSHSRVFTPTSLPRGGGGAQFGQSADLALTRPRVGGWCRDLQYHHERFPSGDCIDPIASTDPLFTPHEPLTQATEGGFGRKCIIVA